MLSGLSGSKSQTREGRYSSIIIYVVVVQQSQIGVTFVAPRTFGHAMRALLTHLLRVKLM